MSLWRLRLSQTKPCTGLSKRRKRRRHRHQQKHHEATSARNSVLTSRSTMGALAVRFRLSLVRTASAHKPKCIEVKRMKPVTTRRGQDSVRLLEIDGRTGAFLVPTKLLRAGQLKLKRIETEGRAPALLRRVFNSSLHANRGQSSSSSAATIRQRARVINPLDRRDRSAPSGL